MVTAGRESQAAYTYNLDFQLIQGFMESSIGGVSKAGQLALCGGDVKGLVRGSVLEEFTGLHKLL